VRIEWHLDNHLAAGSELLRQDRARTGGVTETHSLGWEVNPSGGTLNPKAHCVNSIGTYRSTRYLRADLKSVDN